MYPQLIHHFLLPVYTPYLHQHSPCDSRQNPRSYPHISQCFLLHPVDLQVLLKITLASIKTSIIPLPKSPSLSLHILGPGLTASGSSIASHPPWVLSLCTCRWLTSECPSRSLHPVTSCLSFRPQLRYHLHEENFLKPGGWLKSFSFPL